MHTYTPHAHTHMQCTLLLQCHSHAKGLTVMCYIHVRHDSIITLYFQISWKRCGSRHKQEAKLQVVDKGPCTPSPLCLPLPEVVITCDGFSLADVQTFHDNISTGHTTNVVGHTRHAAWLRLIHGFGSSTFTAWVRSFDDPDGRVAL